MPTLAELMRGNNIATASGVPQTPTGSNTLQPNSFAGPGTLNFLSGNNAFGDPQREDFMRAGFNAAGNIPGRSLEELIGLGTSSNLFRNLYGGQISGLPLAFGNLNEILFGQGRTSPELLNRQRTASERRLGRDLGEIESTSARRGLAGSGVLAALEGAARGGAGGREADLIANENRLMEDRQRSDLMLALQLLINPSLDATAIATGQGAQRSQNAANQDAANAAQQASFLNALVGLYTGRKGGGG